MKKIFIFSAGRMGQEVLRLINAINAKKKKKEWEVLGFVDKKFKTKKIDSIKVFSPQELKASNKIYGITAVSDTSIRENIINKEIKNKFNLATLIHPTAINHHSVKLGKGSVIFANVQLGINLKLGISNIIQFGSDIGHDIETENFVTVFPHTTIGGYCKIGEKVVIGAGSNVLPKIKIGRNSAVSIGSKVIQNVKDNRTYIEKTKIINLKKNV
tara:strand:- start:137 stop:778 length:642 start_codon:yes stop_codon:yes gene_type:complete